MILFSTEAVSFGLKGRAAIRVLLLWFTQAASISLKVGSYLQQSSNRVSPTRSLSSTLKLGIMPENGIAKIIAEKTQHPAKGNGIPRCEINLLLEDLQAYYRRALELGSILVSEIEDRDWGHKACYFSDPDGHILAFAEES